jgi:hypothetical protein
LIGAPGVVLSLVVFLPIAFNTKVSELPSAIFTRWVHSFEEDAADVAVYRPIDYDFPPARGREGFEFREGGEFIEYRIGRADGSRRVTGRWRVEGQNRVHISLDSRGATSYTLEILHCDEELLKVRKDPVRGR